MIHFCYVLPKSPKSAERSNFGFTSRPLHKKVGILSLYTFVFSMTHLSGYWVLNEWAAFETQQACTRSFLDEMTLCHTIKALLCIHALLKKLVVLSTWYIDRMTFIALCRYQVNHIRLNTFSSKVWSRVPFSDCFI